MQEEGEEAAKITTRINDDFRFQVGINKDPFLQWTPDPQSNVLTQKLSCVGKPE